MEAKNDDGYDVKKLEEAEEEWGEWHPVFMQMFVWQVRNGQLPRSPVIGRFCGSTLPSTPIESSSNFMTVTFRTDSSVNGIGFSASYSSNSPAGKKFAMSIGHV